MNQPRSVEALIEGVLHSDIRSAARLISWIESGRAEAVQAVQMLYKRGGKAEVIGITGAPGAGKSTLADRLLTHYRCAGERVAVLAVDPSSPFSGGAILGDRVRMARHNVDRDVFIRSMAARGRLGGLSAASADAITVLDAMGFDRILLETVGVGQSELDVVRLAHTVVVLQTPASGDAIQAEKAGLLEIGDIHVVNKADTPGADRMVSALRESVEHSADHADDTAWLPPVLKAQASQDVGISAIAEAIADHARHMRSYPDQYRARLRAQAEFRVLNLIEEKLRIRYSPHAGGAKAWQTAIDAVVAHETDPHTIAQTLLESGSSA